MHFSFISYDCERTGENSIKCYIFPIYGHIDPTRVPEPVTLGSEVEGFKVNRAMQYTVSSLAIKVEN